MSNFVQSMIKSVAANIKISINNIHVRFEDVETKLAIGLCIKSASLSNPQDSKGKDRIYPEDA